MLKSNLSNLKNINKKISFLIYHFTICSFFPVLINMLCQSHCCHASLNSRKLIKKYNKFIFTIFKALKNILMI